MKLFEGYDAPFEIRPNVVDASLVTVFDTTGLPLLTTHDRDVAETLVDLFNAPDSGMCRICGCTEDAACDLEGVGCAWAEPGLCSNPNCLTEDAAQKAQSAGMIVRAFDATFGTRRGGQ